jgi:hypothetical protein
MVVLQSPPARHDRRRSRTSRRTGRPEPAVLERAGPDVVRDPEEPVRLLDPATFDYFWRNHYPED